MELIETRQSGSPGEVVATRAHRSKWILPIVGVSVAAIGLLLVWLARGTSSICGAVMGLACPTDPKFVPAVESTVVIAVLLVALLVSWALIRGNAALIVARVALVLLVIASLIGAAYTFVTGGFALALP